MANVVELISTMLKREGVRYMFGIPGGGGSIDLLDATEKEGIRFVLTTHAAMQLGVAPVIVVLGDQALSQIKIKQRKKGLGVVGTEFRSPDYIKIAEAFGGKGVSVGTEAEYTLALKDALKSAVFTVIHARIDPSQYAAQFDAIREL